MIGQSDAELIVESLDEPARFGELFERYAEAVFRYLARRIGPDDASDLLADVFLAAFEARFRYRSNFSMALPWLYGIASNLLRKHVRRRAAELKMLDRLVAQGERGGDHVDAHEVRCSPGSKEPCAVQKHTVRCPTSLRRGLPP